jgi:thiol-disulfide isomerase/thioredoxin
MNKLKIILMGLALLSSQAAFASFSDVASDHPNQAAIEYLQVKGIIDGYPDGTFGPERPINRAEMMKILVEGQGVTPDANTYKECFPDVGTEWFAPYVCYAQTQGWVNGYPDGTFKPARNVLNVEAVKMILNAKGFELDKDYATTQFSDISTSEWFYPYAVTAEKLALTEGFEPGAAYARADVSEMIFRTLVIEDTGSNIYSAEARDQLLELNGIEPDSEESTEEPAIYEAYSPEKRQELEGVKPFAIFFHASWCPICRAIEADLKANLSSYPDGLHILVADYDTEAELKKEFGVTRQYYFVIFDTNGEVTFSNNLFTADQVVTEIEKTLE